MKKSPNPQKISRHAMQVWSCKIGEVPVDVLRRFGNGADAPLRRAVQEAFFLVTGVQAEFIFSGWNAELDKFEREVVNRRKNE